jgi:hypothetical protein
LSEADIFASLFADARRAMHEASSRKFYPPRMMLESVRAMARHLQYSNSEAEVLLDPTILHQLFLATVLSPMFTGTSALLPRTYAGIQQRMYALGSGPVVILLFHFSGVSLVGGLMNDAVAAQGFAGRSVLLAPRNAGRLAQQRGHGLGEMAIFGDRAGLRTLMSGLRRGSISHLGLLVDGPQDPTADGAHPVTGIPTLGFRTGLLKWILSAGISVVPVTNHWEGEQLRFEWHEALSPHDGIETVAGLIGRQLRQHPEQWFNWPAVSLRL